MRFLIYANDFYQIYKRGIANYGFNLINALKENGHDVFIYSQNNIKLSKKNHQIYSNQIAVTNELLKEIIYYGKNEKKIRNSLFKRIKKFLSYVKVIFAHNELIKYELNRERYLIENDFIDFNGFYNDNLFKLKEWLSKRFNIPIKIKVPESIDFVISLSPQKIRIYGAPLITVFHDIIPFIDPGHLEENSRDAASRFYMAIKNSYKTLYVSKKTGEELNKIFKHQYSQKSILKAEFLGQPILSSKDVCKFNEIFTQYEKKSFFINQSINPSNLITNNFSRVPYIVSIGAIEPRKNQLQLLEHLLPLIKEKKIKLFFVGKMSEKNYYEKLKKNVQKYNSIYGEMIFVLEDVNKKQLNNLLQGALCMVHYAVYEGFGIPLVEAAKNLCPVITSNNEIYREVGEMISVDIKDSSLLEKEVEKLLNGNIEVRKKIIKNQFNSIKKHHWDIVVKRLEKILKT